MAEAITIKERIERRIEAIVGAIAGIGTVERWDARGNTRDNLSAVIIAEDEVAADGAQGNPGTTTNTLEVTVELLIAQAPKADDTESGSFVHNRWLGNLKAALTADERLVEPDTSEPLAVDVRVTGTSQPPLEEGQSEFFAVLVLEVTYDETRNNPYTAPAVTQKVV